MLFCCSEVVPGYKSQKLALGGNQQQKRLLRLPYIPCSGYMVSQSTQSPKLLTVSVLASFTVGILISCAIRSTPGMLLKSFSFTSPLPESYFKTSSSLALIISQWLSLCCEFFLAAVQSSYSHYSYRSEDTILIISLPGLRIKVKLFIMRYMDLYCCQPILPASFPSIAH